MNLTSRLYKFYGSLIFLYISDMGAMIGITWASLEITQSTIFLGTMLCISSLIPYSIKRIFSNKLSLSISHLYIIRGIIYLIILLITFTGYASHLYGIVITVLLFGIINILTLSVYETYNSYAVNHSYISSDKASRIMQTVLQSGAFLGAIIAGVLLNKSGYTNLLKIIAIYEIILNTLFYFINSSIFLSFKRENKLIPHSHIEKDNKIKSIYLLCIPLGVIGLHISSFNMLSIVIFQNINHWSPILFGYASGIAGIGAFLSAIISIKKLNIMVWAFCLLIFDIIYSNSITPIISILACFFIGFSINTIRITLRKSMLDFATTPSLSQQMGDISAFSYVFFQSIGSIIIGNIISEDIAGEYSSIYIFPLVGVIVLFSVYLNRYIIKEVSIDK